MLAYQEKSGAHAGEDQASSDFAARDAHWKNLAVQLLTAARTLADEYLQQERADVTVCANAEHHQAVRNLCAAIANAGRAGLEQAWTALQAGGAIECATLWSVTGDEFSADSLVDLIKANDWLRPGDYVYQAQTTSRHLLTEADFAQAAAANAPERDPRVADMFGSEA
jgi:hypothetical protein